MASNDVVRQLRQRMQAIESSIPSRAAQSHEHGASPFASQQPRAQRDAEPASCEDAAFKKIVALVNASDKSEKTIRERLRRSGFEDSAIESAVERAISYGFIDDMRYADLLVRSRLNQGKGMAGVERELANQGIDVSCLEGWPYEYGITDESEFQRALDLLKRNPPRSKNKRDGAYRKLVQKGYSASVASSAARTWLEDFNE